MPEGMLDILEEGYTPTLKVCDLCGKNLPIWKVKTLHCVIPGVVNITKDLCDACSEHFKATFDQYFSEGRKIKEEASNMLFISEEKEKCPFCSKWVNMYRAVTKAVDRTYCPECLMDIEVTWKERR